MLLGKQIGWTENSGEKRQCDGLSALSSFKNQSMNRGYTGLPGVQTQTHTNDCSKPSVLTVGDLCIFTAYHQHGLNMAAQMIVLYHEQ